MSLGGGGGEGRWSSLEVPTTPAETVTLWGSLERQSPWLGVYVTASGG